MVLILNTVQPIFEKATDQGDKKRTCKTKSTYMEVDYNTTDIRISQRSTEEGFLGRADRGLL